MQEPLYTPEDMQAGVDSNTGNYSIIQNIAQVATGKPVGMDINYNEFVDNEWSNVAPTLQQTDEAIANDAAVAGDDVVMQRALESMSKRADMFARRNSASYDEVFEKSKDLASEAIQRINQVSDAVLINNTAEEIAQVQEELSTSLASQAALQKELLDITNVDWFSLGTVGGILHEMSPIGPLQGGRIQQLVTAEPEKWGIASSDVNLFTTRNELASMLRMKYQTLTDEEKLPWVKELYNKLDNSIFTNKLHLSLFFSEIVGDDPITIGGFSDWADRVGVILLPAQVAGVALKLTNRAAKIASMANLEKSLAAAGGKGILEAQATQQALQSMMNAERIKAGLEVASELSGVQGAIDLTKLVSVSASKVLPESITTSVKSTADVIRADIAKTIDNLRAANSAPTIGAETVVAQLQDLRKTFSTASNPYVHNSSFRLSDDGLSVVGKVYYKPADRSSYLTTEAAELANKNLYGGRGKVVPDTTNTGFLVEDDVVKNLELERTALIAERAEALTEAPRTRSKRKTEVGEGVGSQEAPKAPTEAFNEKVTTLPKSLAGAKPRYSFGDKQFQLEFDSDIDKALYIVAQDKPSKRDAEYMDFLRKAALTDLTDEQIRAFGRQVRDAIKKQADTAEAGVLRIRDQAEVAAETPRASGGVATSKSTLDDSVSSKLFTDSSFTTVDNIVYSSKVPNIYILPFVQRLGKALGMDKHKVAVLQLSDITNNPDYSSIVDLYRSFGVDTDALHIPTRHGSIIVMGKDVRFTTRAKDSDIGAYMQLFAHEYGHAFEYAFQVQYGDTFKNIYRNWLSSKNIKYSTVGDGLHVSEVFPIEALFDFRNINFADNTIAQKDISEWVSKWMAGNIDEYGKFEKPMREWLSHHSEFFAENFSKWALTNDVPTTILGEAFKKLSDGIKLLASELSAMLRMRGVSVTLKADAGVANFLNEHIKRVKAGSVTATKLADAIPAASKGVKRTAKDIDARIMQIEEELAAIDAARKGLRHGYLIEADVSKQLTYAEAGRYTDEDIDSAMSFAFGDWALIAAKDAVDARLIGVHAHSRYTNVLTNFIRPYVEKLNKSEQIMLDDVLKRGDAEGKVFDENFLAGAGMSPRAREAYFRVRALRDIMYQVKNDTVSAVLTRKGFFELKMAPAKYTGDKLFGKVVTNKTGSIAYDISAGKSTRITENTDGIVFELAKPTEVNGKHYRTVVINADDVTQTQITDAIPYRVGEYSRQYEDEYFVKINSTMLVDESATAQKITHRTAATKTDAKAYVDAFNEMVSLFNAGKLDIVSAAKMEAFGWKADDFVEQMQTGAFGQNPKGRCLLQPH
jgi:hypothetical protein